MGLHGDWKAIIKQLFPNVWLRREQLPKDLYILLVDLNLLVYAKPLGVKTGKDYFHIVSSPVREFFARGGKTVVLLGDKSDKVPLAKAPTQMARRSTVKQLPASVTASPNTFEIGDGALPHNDQWSSVMASWQLRAKVFEYIELKFKNSYFQTYPNAPAGAKIIIDGISGAVPYGVINGDADVYQYPAYANDIGEADLKIPYYINHIFPEEPQILVHSKDTDSIKILLMHAALRIDKHSTEHNADHAQFRNRVFLRLNYKNLMPEKEAAKEAAEAGKKAENDALHDLLEREKKEKEKEKEKDAEEAKHSDEDPDHHDDGHNSAGEKNEDTPKKKTTKKKTTSKSSKSKSSSEEEEDKNEIVDINLLYDALLGFLSENVPTMRDPINHLGVLMTLGGDDFVKNLPNVGPETLLNVFSTNFQDFGNLINIDDQRTVKKMDGDEGYATVTINEDAILKYIKIIYQFKLKSHIPKDSNPDLGQLRTLSEEHWSRIRAKVPAKEQLEWVPKQIGWVMSYHLNGASKQPKFPNCLDVDDVTKKSVYGWGLADPNARADRKNIVSLAFPPESSESMKQAPAPSAPPAIVTTPSTSSSRSISPTSAQTAQTPTSSQSAPTSPPTSSTPTSSTAPTSSATSSPPSSTSSPTPQPAPVAVPLASSTSPSSISPTSSITSPTPVSSQPAPTSTSSSPSSTASTPTSLPTSSGSKSREVIPAPEESKFVCPFGWMTRHPMYVLVPLGFLFIYGWYTNRTAAAKKF